MRLVRFLGLAPGDAPDLIWRREPHFEPPKVVDIEREHLCRMPPVVFVGFVTEKDVEGGVHGYWLPNHTEGVPLRHGHA